MKTITAALTILLCASTPFPLSQEEISDAHTCFGAGQLMICAGEKKILTGIGFIPDIQGTQIVGFIPHLQEYRTDINAQFQVDFEVSFMQNKELNNTPWKIKYYIMTDEQLSRIINRARKEPEWKPE